MCRVSVQEEDSQCCSAAQCYTATRTAGRVLQTKSSSSKGGSGASDGLVAGQRRGPRPGWLATEDSTWSSAGWSTRTEGQGNHIQTLKVTHVGRKVCLLAGSQGRRWEKGRRSDSGLERAVDPPLMQVQVQQPRACPSSRRWVACSALGPALTQDPLSGGARGHRG